MQAALLSVTDKEGLPQLALALVELYPDIKLIASGGTARCLRDAGLAPVDIVDYTGAEECFGGRVKTLHPMVAGGILFQRGVHEQEAESLGIPPIDLVVCNLYQFEKAAGETRDVSQLIEEIDIGGVTLIRAAAKNHASVSVLVEPSDYPRFLTELRQGELSVATRQHLAVKAFNHTADYEATIAETLSRELAGEETRRVKLGGGQKLRYGENPDQEGWFYQLESSGLGSAELLGGKPLSYNNLEDATAAYRAALDLHHFSDDAGVAIIKHGNICGYAIADSLIDAFEDAWAGDPKSAFGSVIAITQEVTGDLLESLKGRFMEVLLAPSFSEAALEWLKSKKPNLRVLQVSYSASNHLRYKSVNGGMLIQTEKAQAKSPWQPVTKTKPSEGDEQLLRFAVCAVQHAKSNAIAIARKRSNGFQLLAMGAGQPNRIDSLERLAIPKAIENLQREGSTAAQLGECALASDGFFPFADSVEAAAKYGIKLCVQPGGSVRDDEVIAAADAAEMQMMFTGERYFTH